MQSHVYALFDLDLMQGEINPLPLASLMCQTARLIALHHLQYALDPDRQT